MIFCPINHGKKCDEQDCPLWDEAAKNCGLVALLANIGSIAYSLEELVRCEHIKVGIN